jgi:hypothetical protein
MTRRVLAVATLLAIVTGCSGSGTRHETAAGKTCSDACGAIFACATQLGYDLSQNGMTPASCVADCSGGDCGGAVNDCIAALTCPATIDLLGLALLGCGQASTCTVGLPVPIGACDTVAATGQCIEYLGDTDPDYSRSYCTVAMGGTWVPTCPVSGRAGACLVFVDAYGGGSRQLYYTSYSGGLAAAEAACKGNPYGGVWTTY